MDMAMRVVVWALIAMGVGACWGQELDLGPFFPSGEELGQYEQYEALVGGEEKGEPFEPAAFVFAGGRYIEAPYRVDRRGSRVFINGFLADIYYSFVPGDVEFAKPVPPPNLAEMKNLEDARYYDSGIREYLERTVPSLEERNKLYLEFLRSLPMVRKLELGKPPSETDVYVTYTDGSGELLWKALEWNEHPMAEEYAARARERQQYWEKRLREEAGTLLLGASMNRGESRWWTDSTTREKLPKVVAAIDAPDEVDESLRWVFEKYLQNVKPSAQLEARLKKLLATPVVHAPPALPRDFRKEWREWIFPHLVEIADAREAPEVEGLRLLIALEEKDQEVLPYEPVWLYCALINTADTAPEPLARVVSSWSPPFPRDEQPFGLELTGPDGESTAGRPWPVIVHYGDPQPWHVLGARDFRTCGTLCSAFADGRQPLFTTAGTYKLRLVYHASAELTLTSNPIQVTVRDPRNEAEREAMQILGDPKVRATYFDYDLIYARPVVIPVLKELVRLAKLDMETNHRAQVLHDFTISTFISPHRMVQGFGIPETDLQRYEDQLRYARSSGRWIMKVLGLEPPEELTQGAWPYPIQSPPREKRHPWPADVDPWDLNASIPRRK